MNEQSTYLVQAVRGPIMLITIGVLFAFDRFTEFRFSQTWPVLLIIGGLLRLVGGPRRRYRDYYQAPGAPPPPPPLHDHPMPDQPSPKYAESQYGSPTNPEARP